MEDAAETTAADPPSSGTPSDRFRFLLEPKWLASHAFALTLVAVFVWAGFWQLGRLDERQAQNEIVEARAFAPAAPLEQVLPAATDTVTVEADALDYTTVEVRGRYLDGEFVRVANRSQDGRAGDWVVATFLTDSGRILSVNRGFVARTDEVAPVDDGAVELSGWLRTTRERGIVGAADSGTGDRIPRLNIDDIEARLIAAGGLPAEEVPTDAPIVPLWLQLDSAPIAGGAADAAVIPEPVPLESIDDGNHLSYAVQWFTFALLSVVIYSLALRRIARDRT